MTDEAFAPQGDLRLLNSAVAQRLLTSSIPARYAYNASDGTPRILSSWFHWTGDELVMPTFIAAPHACHPARRINALRARPDIAVSIDTETSPPEVLLLRGQATVTEVDGIPTEYVQAAVRYLGSEAADPYLDGLNGRTVRAADT